MSSENVLRMLQLNINKPSIHSIITELPGSQHFRNPLLPALAPRCSPVVTGIVKANAMCALQNEALIMVLWIHLSSENHHRGTCQL